MEIKPKSGTYTQLFIDGELFRELHISVFGKRPKFSPVDEELHVWFYKHELRFAKNYAFRKIAAMSISSFALEKAFRERGISTQAAEEVIALLKRDGYINDEEWIERFVACQKKKYGAQAILAKCRQKGIAEKFVLPYLKGSDFRGDIQNLMQTRYRKYDLSDPKQKQKVFRSLLGKGFSFEEIKDSVN